MRVQIKNTKGDKLVLTDKSVTMHFPDRCHCCRMMLINVKPGKRIGFIVPISDTCVFLNGGVKPDTYYVSFKTRRIGCCYFDQKTWDRIVKAAKKSQAKKGKPNGKAAK